MVGKGVEVKSSRIFQQCYVRCCKLQNLTPLSAVLPTGNGTVLDFCVDRIKYQDWPPILNALSCDLSLHSVTIKCRQQVKTVLEHIDCERLAKTVSARPVALTKFVLGNLAEALAQLLAGSALLAALALDGLPLPVPYLNPLCEALAANSSLQQLSLARCGVGDAGCAAVCAAARHLPNLLVLDLSGCDLTPLGAQYVADLLKYQKIHRYSESWAHTLRYRRPALDATPGLRRVSLCANPALGDAGLQALLDVLADDLWIKALDVQNCGLTEAGAVGALAALRSNTALVVLDVRANAAVPPDAAARLRAALRRNDHGSGGAQYSWLSVSGSSSDGRSVKCVPSKNVIIRDRGHSNVRNAPNKYLTKTSTVKKERQYSETLEEQLAEEISHRQQLEELNGRLVQQLQRLQQQRLQLWDRPPASSGSEQSLEASSCSGSSGSSSSVPIDHNTLAYIQQAFKDIYAFIKNNQCNGECLDEKRREPAVERPIEDIPEARSSEELAERAPLAAKRAQSSHGKLVSTARHHKTTKSAHLLGDMHARAMDAKPEMIERHMGDTKIVCEEEQIIMDDIIAHTKGSKGSYSRASSCGSVSDSSDTLVYSPRPPHPPRSPPRSPPNPRDALCSSSDEDD